jgi:hypothetical protein
MVERRRLQAADLFALGKTRAEVAGDLGVSAQTTSRRYAHWRDGGVAGMRTARQGNLSCWRAPTTPANASERWTAWATSR